jgi:hypothetical protein
MKTEFTIGQRVMVGGVGPVSLMDRPATIVRLGELTMPSDKSLGIVGGLLFCLTGEEQGNAPNDPR